MLAVTIFSGGMLLLLVVELELPPYFWQARKPADRPSRIRARDTSGFFTGVQIG
jgi:hypothetical protein